MPLIADRLNRISPSQTIAISTKAAGDDVGNIEAGVGIARVLHLLNSQALVWLGYFIFALIAATASA